VKQGQKSKVESRIGFLQTVLPQRGPAEPARGREGEKLAQVVGNETRTWVKRDHGQKIEVHE
jgi:hypothetical protein